MYKSNQLESVSCPLCGENNTIKICSSGQFGLPCHVTLCKNDGLVYLNPRWSKERYNYFYQHEFDKYYRPTIFKPAEPAQKYKTAKQVCERLETVKHFQARGSVLDIGAGPGDLLDWMRMQYSEFSRFSAIESSKRCLSEIDKKPHIELIGEDIDLWDEDDKFDLIIMRHVLEHFMDPVATLNKIASNLSASGSLYIAVPDMMHPRGSMTESWFRAVHTFYFSQKTLIQACNLAGLELVETGLNNSEVWGIFRLGSHKEKMVGQQVYLDQKRLLDRVMDLPSVHSVAMQ